MTNVEKDWILSLPLDRKIMLMESMLEQKEIGHYLGFVKILLDAPISKGGVSTETIDKVFKKYYPDSKNPSIN